MPARSWSMGLLMAACLVLGSGCGSEGKRRALSGVVTFQGQPLEHGTVTFLTTSAPPGPAGGALIRAGRYDIPASQGLEPGTYRVMVSSPGPGGTLRPEEVAAGASPRAREGIPARYNSDSTLTIEVKPAGANRFDFHLE